MKCGLSYMKQQKIAALKVQNQKLNKELDQLLNLHESQGTLYKNKNMQFINVTTQIEVQTMRRSILKTSINSLTLQNQNTQKQNIQLTKKLAQTEHQNVILNNKLHELNKEKQQSFLLLTRIKKSLKMYHNINGINSNVMKGHDNLKKVNQCLLRQLQVLQNKLESHKKYYAILQKKQIKQKKMQEQNKNPNLIYKAKSHTQIHFYTKNVKNNCQVDKADKKQAEINRKKVKELDEAIRKKNQMLLKKNI